MPFKEAEEVEKSAAKAGLKKGSKRCDKYFYGTEALIKKRRAAKRARQEK